jgi:acyl-[acyl-carrier-protein]-phospholipid O-acyltransferase/long-chain-fatty-acid--[acyl-carrier-protein] ligase
MRNKTQLGQMFLRRCKQGRSKSKLADSTGADMTGGELLTRTLVARRLLRRHVLADDEQRVAVLLPPSAGGLIANMALALDRRVSVNLNYTATDDILNTCIELAGVKHVLTSRRFLSKMPFQLNAELVYLEDFREQATSMDKAIAALQAYAMPSGLLARHLGLHKVGGDDLLTIIFTSGSTGVPKGVMLSHANVQHNVDAVGQVVKLTTDDVMVGILPFFHSFGYTVTLWAVMALGVKGVYHFNPLDAKLIGSLCEKHGGTLLVSTPTFLRSYLRRCTREQLQTIDVVVAGAEKLPRDLVNAFDEKFGVRPIEGYGTTELSPLVAVNIPPSRASGDFQIEVREGTVGRPVPGVAAKVVHTETGAELGPGEAGMLKIKGPNVMLGYLGQEDLTAEVIRDGWYTTGDIAVIDEDGFIQITGRESRFSKIGGEMVPHIKIEEELADLIGVSEDGGVKVAVTAVPDQRKGERLVVFHTKLDKQPDELCRGLADAGLPNLFIPSTDSFVELEELPILGTGKLDLKGIKQIALERFGDGT